MLIDSMMIRTYSSWVLVQISIYVSAVSDSSYFTSNNVLDNMYSTVNLIAQEEATTVVDCAHKCTSLSSCQSLFYLSSIQSCLLNSAIYNTGNIGHIGAVYFEKLQQNNGVSSQPSVTTDNQPAGLTSSALATVKIDTTTTAAIISCTLLPCQNHGQCQSHFCACTPNFAGYYCEKAYSLSGCYSITLPVSGGSGSMYPLKCVEICMQHSKDYAGLTKGDECWCGDSLSSGSQAIGCSQPCTGSSMHYCGGLSVMSMYHIF